MSPPDPLRLPKSAMPLNTKSPGVRRILEEAKEIQADPSVDFVAVPSEENVFEWHFTIRGPPGTDFEGGRFHGRITLPAQYPFRPPSFRFTHPNGRFEVEKEICLSISNHHEELWSPSWGVRTALMGLIGFLPTKANGAIGGVDFSSAERKRIATASRDYTCSVCQAKNIELLPDVDAGVELPKSKENPVKLSFGYKGQITPSEDVTSERDESPEPDPTRPLPVPERPSPWIDRFLFVFLVLLAIMVYRKVA